MCGGCLVVSGPVCHFWIPWAQCHLARTRSCVCILGLPGGGAILEGCGTLGGGTLQEEMSHRCWAVSFDSQTLLPVLFLFLDF